MRKIKDQPWVKLLSPSVSRDEIGAVEGVLKSGWWGLGPVTEEFEKEFARFVGVRYAVALNSCTSALHLAVRVLSAKSSSRTRRKKIIVPALTFVATAAVALYEGYQVEFADIEEETYCLDSQDVAGKIDRDTVAIIPVHYAGRLADMNYGNSKISIIEDCAHAAGTKGAGKTGVVSCWSFHPVKNIATGDGGMLTTNNKNIAERVKKLRWFGISLSTYDREEEGYNWEYTIDDLGYKYHANDIMSAIGLVQLRRIEELNRKRKEISARYKKELRGLPIILPPESGSWHLFVIRVGKKYRNKLVEFLRERKISPGVHYKPLYYYSIFGVDVGKIRENLPVTEKVWQEIISLPIHPELTDQEQERVIAALREFF